MNFVKNTIFSILTITLVINITFANIGTVAIKATDKLGDIIISELKAVKGQDTKLIELLVKKGIERKSAIRMARYTKLALKSFSNKKTGPSGTKELKRILESIEKNVASEIAQDRMIGKIILDGQNQATIVKKSLNKKALNMEKDDLTKILSDLYYLAGRHGRRGSFVVVCGACANDALAREGLEFTLEELFEKGTKKTFIKRIKNKSAVQIAKQIKNELTGLGVQNLDNLARENERSMALFLELRRSGTKIQKQYAEAVMELSKTADGQFGDLLQHTLWNNLDLFDGKYLDGWINLIKQTTETKNTAKLSSIEKAWYKTLRSKAGDDVEKLNKVSRMEVKRCFMLR